MVQTFQKPAMISKMIPAVMPVKYICTRQLEVAMMQWQVHYRGSCSLRECNVWQRARVRGVQAHHLMRPDEHDLALQHIRHRHTGLRYAMVIRTPLAAQFRAFVMG